ncbi:hypothetical protein [Methanolobus profundi]|uniref:Uncharacterized protein n=1 Tax=Methanolobus profundi TaxID=487685 RepID=A0A1I4R430_9EURY|nr:hypothetical protein [Methanolobus profundi]SFM47052.1 hypothetical protein SAMN04488696_1352 [Methanolobus profundi]
MDFRLIFILGFAGFVVTVILLAIVITYLNEKRRSKNLAEQAGGIGFEPATKDIVTSIGFRQTQLGNKQKVYNVLTGTFDGMQVIFFDITIVIGHFITGSTSSHGGSFKSSGIIFKEKAPIFELQPRSPISKNAYNKYFSLKGDTSLMNDSLAERIGRNYAIESNGTHVLFVPSGKRVEDMGEEVKAAYGILQDIIQRY